MLEKQIEEIEAVIKTANDMIFESLEVQGEIIDNVRDKGRRDRDDQRRLIELCESEISALRIVKLCHTGK